MDKQEGGILARLAIRLFSLVGFLLLAYGLRKMSGWRGLWGFLAGLLSQREADSGQAIEGTLSTAALQCPWSVGQPECASHCQDGEATMPIADRWRSDPDASPAYAYLKPIKEDPVDIPLSWEWTLAWVIWAMAGAVVIFALLVIGATAGLFLAFR